MSKLWQKNYTVDSLLEEFTVGRDYELDNRLLVADVYGSLAQARGLVKAGLLTQEEYRLVHQGLLQVKAEFEAGQLVISRSDEDCHTAIENRLVQICGEPGKKIHTGRSRNDQVVTALRIAGRQELLDLLPQLYTLVEALLDFAEEYRTVPMPGRTHMQTGMPSSVGLWAGSFAEQLLDDGFLVSNALELLNQGSLGSAAGYGVPLPLDRQFTSDLLGFGQVQNNVLGVSNSRGRHESVILDALDQVGISLSKFAQDLILFSLPEFGYFTLPVELTTGSSIMPQKKNPDGLELTRAKSGVLGGYAQQVKNIIRSLPTGYNRDFQETKEPFLRGLELASILLKINTLTVKGLKVNRSALEKAFTPDIFATDAAYELVMQGKAFRDAYREVGLNLDRLTGRDPQQTIANRTLQGGAGNLGLDKVRRRLSDMRAGTEKVQAATRSALAALEAFQK